jgi:transcriptional regulator GlxA family with amidase domain
VSEHELKEAADAYLAWCRTKETTPQVNELAARLQLTVSKFSNDFLAAVGVRPSTYLKRQTLQEAIHLIQTTTLNHATIARMTGFGSRTTLSRAIRRMTGRLPESFRR